MTDSPQRPSSGTQQIRVAEAKAGLYARIGAGIFFMLAGTSVFVWGVVLDNHKMMYGGAGATVVGAMILPSVFDAIKPFLTWVAGFVPFLRRGNGGPPAPPSSGASQGNPS